MLKSKKPAKRVVAKVGVNLDPKTDAEALELLRWTYGPQVPESNDSRNLLPVVDLS